MTSRVSEVCGWLPSPAHRLRYFKLSLRQERHHLRKTLDPARMSARSSEPPATASRLASVFSATTAAAAPYSTDLVTSYTNDSGRLNNLDERMGYDRKRNHMLCNNNNRERSSTEGLERPNSKTRPKQLAITNSSKGSSRSLLAPFSQTQSRHLHAYIATCSFIVGHHKSLSASLTNKHSSQSLRYLIRTLGTTTN